MRHDYKTLIAAFCILLAYCAIWSIHPESHRNDIQSFISEWNGSADTPYLIEYDEIAIKRNFWSSPLQSTVAVVNMRLVFRDSNAIISTKSDTELSKWLLCDRQSSCGLHAE